MLELEKLLPKKNSVRQLRVAEQIQKIIAEVIAQKQISNRILLENFISVSKVNIGADLHNATVFVTVFNDVDKKQLIEELNKIAHKFRAIINKEIKLKSSPQILFRYDDSLENIDRINKLLNSTDSQN